MISPLFFCVFFAATFSGVLSDPTFKLGTYVGNLQFDLIASNVTEIIRNLEIINNDLIANYGCEMMVESEIDKSTKYEVMVLSHIYVINLQDGPKKALKLFPSAEKCQEYAAARIEDSVLTTLEFPQLEEIVEKVVEAEVEAEKVEELVEAVEEAEAVEAVEAAEAVEEINKLNRALINTMASDAVAKIQHEADRAGSFASQKWRDIRNKLRRIYG